MAPTFPSALSNYASLVSSARPSMLSKSTSAGKHWETAVADSPVRHAILNKPFTTLRKRTEVLLDSITGGTLPPNVLEEERKQKEAERQLKCRGCRIVFGSERGLNSHLDLFPSHVNPPEYERKTRRRRSRRSQSASDVLTSSSSNRPRARHIRAETMAELGSRGGQPVITASEDSSLPTFEEAVQAAAAATRPSRPLPSIPITQERQSAVPKSAPAPAPVVESQVVDNAPLSTPLLPALDFGSFKLISQDTGLQPNTARPIAKKTEQDNIITRNMAAGAAVASKLASKKDEQRTLNRGASESALTTVTMPTSVLGATRAIIATGKAGALEPAVPFHAATTISVKDQAAYGPLSGEEEVKQIKAKKSNPSIEWSNLRRPLPGAPDKQEKARPKMVERTATGLTSFSDEQPASPSTPILPRMLPRRNTNPFLNESFMNSLPPTKTPPLTPSSPFARYSPGNPFALLSDEEIKESDHSFFATPETPKESTQTNPFFISSEQQDDDILSISQPYKTSSSAAASVANPSKQKSALSTSRSVHFDEQTALKASDSPQCPSCRQAFVNLQNVLSHIDESDCNPFHLGEGQTICAY